MVIRSFPLLLLLSFVAFTSKAQYYYNDLLNNKKLNEEYRLLRSAQLFKTALESFEDDDSPSDGFFCEKKFNREFTESIMISRSQITGESEMKSTYHDGKIIKTETITSTSSNVIHYTYDGDLIRSVKMETEDSAGRSSFVEERVYEYDENNRPRTMKRLKNGAEVSTVEFKIDLAGNVIEELPVIGNSDRKFYYYYDENGRLTDVVRYNPVAQRLLPDYMFAYNSANQVSQMISVEETGRNYYIWRYSYRTDGLPEIQKIYSKEKKLLGTIQFEYLK